MAKLYTVDDITERTTITPKGLIQKSWRISATTKSGIFFTMEVLEPDFTKIRIDEILSERARLIEETKAL